MPVSWDFGGVILKYVIQEVYGGEKLLSPEQDFGLIKETILNVLKEQKVSLSQARYVFNCILRDIEDENLINI